MKKSLGKRIISGVTSALLGISALTQAVPLNNGGLLMARAANSEKDGLPIMDKPYEESMWYRGGPLGVAGDFHIFAFDTAEVKEHTNGNVAAPHVIGGNASPNQYITRLVNVIGENWDTSGITMNNIPDVVVPANYEVYAQNPANAKLNYPTPKSKFFINSIGATRSENLDSSYIGHWTENFINFESKRKDYSEMSDAFAEKEQNTVVEMSEDGDYKNILIRLNSKGENIVNLKYEDFFIKDATITNEPQKSKIKIVGLNLTQYETEITNADGEITKVQASKINDNQSVIINLDMSGYEGDSVNFVTALSDTFVKYYGEEKIEEN